jgi:hypothetical protein
MENEVVTGTCLADHAITAADNNAREERNVYVTGPEKRKHDVAATQPETSAKTSATRHGSKRNKAKLEEN